jgi:hypothetical protein
MQRIERPIGRIFGEYMAHDDPVILVRILGMGAMALLLVFDLRDRLSWRPDLPQCICPLLAQSGRAHRVG